MRLIAACALVMLSAAADAQTVETTTELESLGYGEIGTPRAIETDGDEHTREWLITRQFFIADQFRVLAIRDGRVCAGKWFQPLGFFPPAHDATIQRVGRVDKMVVRHSDLMTIVALDTPKCGNH